MGNVAVVFAYNTIGCIGIEALIAAGFDVKVVFTHKDNPNENIYFKSVSRCSAIHQIETFAPKNVNDEKWVKYIQSIKPDYIFSFYYRDKIAQEILNLAAKSAFNLHGSLLPKYRGCAPINWTIINGENETGVTLHEMTSTLDAGDIIDSERIAITPTETGFTLMEKTCHAADRLLARALLNIKNNTHTKKPQNKLEVTTYPRRKPSDGLIDWSKSTVEILNLIRAVTYPFPGALTYYKHDLLKVWTASSYTIDNLDRDLLVPGMVCSLNPFVIRCQDGFIKIDVAELVNSEHIALEHITNINLSGQQLTQHLGIKIGNKMGHQTSKHTKTIFIMGANGFIGANLVKQLLAKTDYKIIASDITNDALKDVKSDRFEYHHIDIQHDLAKIEQFIQVADVILPLVAIATPLAYTQRPIEVFNLDFEANLKVIHLCAQYHKRVVFPSTSEVYGMCQDEYFDEYESNLVVGSITKQRWIYSASKQLLDRVIYAYGDAGQFSFTLFRPFNWVGPNLDSIERARTGNSRAITQMIANLIDGKPIKLVDGGEQKRCFTDIDEGIDALIRIIINEQNLCHNQIINIGNPENEYSIKQLAELTITAFEHHPLRQHFPETKAVEVIDHQSFYGEGYQDMRFRKPAIEQAKKLLGWQPYVGLAESIEKTIDFFLKQSLPKV